MKGDWPLVGRAEHLERLDAWLRGGSSGVVLAGQAGVGKTRLATECLTLASTLGFVPLRVAATQAAASLSLGAFAPLLPDLVPGLDRAEVLRQAATAISGRASERPVALFVDDVHLLDEASAVLTHQLARQPNLFLLATLRSGEPTRDAVVALWKDGLADRLDLGPLSEAEVSELLGAVLGGPVDGGTLHLLCTRSAGNALLLHELVLGALEAGTFREDGGLWQLHGALPPSVRLVEIIERRLAGLETAQQQTLEILALGQPLGVDLLERLGGGDHLETLEQRRLVTSEQDRRRLSLRLSHPLYGEVLRSRLSPLRARAVSRSLADAIEAVGHRRRDDILRLATWRLEGGGTIQAPAMLAGAVRARALFEIELGERLARAAIEADPIFDARLLLAELLFLQGRYDEAETVLSALASTVEDGGEDQRARVALMRIDSLAFGGRAEEAMIVLLEAEATVEDPAWRDELAVKRAMFALVGGFTDVAAELVEPLLTRVSGTALVTAGIVAGLVFGLQGRLTDALAATERGLAAHEGLAVAHMAWYPEMTIMIRARDLLWAGELAAADAISERGYRAALAQAKSDEVRTWFCGSLAQSLVIQGRIAEGIRWARECVNLLRPLGRKIYFRLVLLPLIEALAFAGEADEADEVLAELEDGSVPMFHWEDAEVERARAWIAVARGETSGALRLLGESAAIAARSGDRVIESAALHDLARLGRAADVAPRLAELACVIEGPLAPARSAHAAALIGKDPGALEAASAGFEALGAVLFAAEAAVDAAIAWRRAGEPRRAAAAEHRAGVLAARCTGARTPGLATSAPARAALTARELEIARRAAAGMSNKEIAAQLCLSLRTVENKLHSAYEKLGIDGRGALAEALEAF